MEEYKSVFRTGIIILIILVLLAAGYYFLFYKKGKEPVSAEALARKKAAELAPEEKISPEKGISELPPVELDKSDDLVRQLAQGLSLQAQLSLWLKSDNLIRKFVAAVDNIANGLSPRIQVDFFTPKGNFKVIRKGRRYYLDPSSSERYNQVVDVFDSLNTEESIKLYRKLKPLIQEAYQDLGYPREDFDQTLYRAIVELLNTPVVKGEILLEKKVVTYMIVDQELENLSEAQKHLLRMGGENIQIVQAKLLQFARGLGFPESRLPQPRVYSPQTGRY